ncbi:MAG TPA: phosphoribosyltransferase family protein [Steroidobacteraceae bacterium]|jgi:predicted phosphoribosyltransferase|nr:phosphoribosyltransferase family protein [Steroidobacteraceae bacterium]
MASTARVFADRAAAGVELARALQQRKLPEPLLVLALPRGGVPVAHEIALALEAPLDVMLVRKVGLPEQPELAIGAIASGDIVVRDHTIERLFPDIASTFDRVAAAERRELLRREAVFRAGLAPLALAGQTVILVDDGLATGSTMLAAVRAARAGKARRVVVAAPVASPQAAQLLAVEADELVILQIPPMLFAIGEWYERFEQLEDAEVRRLLALHPRQRSAPGGSDQTPR